MLCACFAKTPPWSLTTVWIALRSSGRAAVATDRTTAVKTDPRKLHTVLAGLPLLRVYLA